MGSPLHPSPFEMCGGRGWGGQGIGARVWVCTASRSALWQSPHSGPRGVARALGALRAQDRKTVTPGPAEGSGKNSSAQGHQGGRHLWKPWVMESVPLDQGAHTLNTHSRRPGAPNPALGVRAPALGAVESRAQGSGMCATISRCLGPRDGGEAVVPLRIRIVCVTPSADLQVNLTLKTPSKRHPQ